MFIPYLILVLKLVLFLLGLYLLDASIRVRVVIKRFGLTLGFGAQELHRCADGQVFRYGLVGSLEHPKSATGTCTHTIFAASAKYGTHPLDGEDDEAVAVDDMAAVDRGSPDVGHDASDEQIPDSDTPAGSYTKHLLVVHGPGVREKFQGLLPAVDGPSPDVQCIFCEKDATLLLAALGTSGLLTMTTCDDHEADFRAGLPDAIAETVPRIAALRAKYTPGA